MSKLTFYGHKYLTDEFNKLGFKLIPVETFRTSDYDDCWLTMQDVVNIRYDELLGHSYVHKGYVEIEKVFDDPRVEISIWPFLTERSQKIWTNWKDGYLSDENGDRDVEWTFKELEEALENWCISKTVMDFIHRQPDPQFKVLKTMVAYRRMCGNYDREGNIVEWQKGAA